MRMSGHRERRAGHDRHAQIGDLQRRRLGRAIDVRLHEIGGRRRGRLTRHRDRGAGPDPEALEERSPIDRRVTVVEKCADGGFHADPPSDIPMFQACDVDARLRIESVSRRCRRK